MDSFFFLYLVNFEIKFKYFRLKKIGKQFQDIICYVEKRFEKQV